MELKEYLQEKIEIWQSEQEELNDNEVFLGSSDDEWKEIDSKIKTVEGILFEYEINN